MGRLKSTFRTIWSVALAIAGWIRNFVRGIVFVTELVVFWIRKHPRLACLAAGFISGFVAGALV